VGKVRPDLPKAWARVQLWQLLQHSSGIPDLSRTDAFSTALGSSLFTPPAPVDLLSFVADQPLEFRPGSKYAYSNSDNVIVGLMVETATGSPLWTATLGGTGKSVSTPAYANGVLYATSTNGRLYAVSATGTSCSGTPTTCTPLWRSMVGTRSGAPAIASCIVYSATSGGIQAFDATGQSGCGGTPLTCTPQWTATGSTAATPAIANCVLYVGQLTGPVQAFDAAGTIDCSGAPKTCQPLWTGDDATGSPVVANGALFIRNGAQAGEDVYESLLVYALVPPQ
jgi:outer membrane protein assembly factor BamB